MVSIIIILGVIIFLGLLVGGIIWAVRADSKDETPPSPEGYGEAKEKGLIEKQAEEKRRNKEAILGILETQHPLTNNHVEQLLGISDATAERYLQELENEGKIKQVGKTGRDVYYEKI